MKPMLAILTLILTITPAFARIGETPAECIARYGEPVEIDKEKSQLIFMKGTMAIIAGFFDGKCDKLVMRKVEQDIIGTPEEISDNEIDLLKEANGGEKPWREKPLISMTKLWETEDGAILAQYEPLNRLLVIFTRECNERQKAAKKAEEQKKLDGF